MPSARPAPKLPALVVLVLLTGCSGGVLAPAGPVGAGERQLFFEALVEMLAIIVPVIVLTLAFAWWFRAGNTRARYTPEWEYDDRVEFVVWVIPLLVVIFLGVIAWVGSHQLDPYERLASKKRAIEVEVVALDWKWLFVYPELGVASVNELALPVGTPVHFRLTSGTVFNTFFVPRLGSMIYVMPGMATQLNLQADKPGTFAGLSGHFSGDGFSDMHFNALATDDAGFAAWVARARAARPLDTAGLRALAKPSQAVPVGYYGGVAPGMFDAIVHWSTQTPGARTLSHGGSVEGADGPPVPDPGRTSAPMAEMTR